MSKNPSKKNRYQRLFVAWESGEGASLVVQARRFLADYPDHCVAWALYGIGLCDIARYDESRNALLHSMKLCPPEHVRFVCVQMGHLYREMGDYQTAARWYRKASKEDPDDAGPHIFLGAALAKQGLLDAAEKAHRRATKCKRGCLDEAFCNLGFVLRAKERIEEALVCFQKALELEPEYPVAKIAHEDVAKAIEWLRDKQ